MKRIYIKPIAETIDLNTYEIMQGLQIPVSGGTTPEESDSKQGFFDEDEFIFQRQRNIWDD